MNRRRYHLAWIALVALASTNEGCLSRPASDCSANWTCITEGSVAQGGGAGAAGAGGAAGAAGAGSGSGGATAHGTNAAWTAGSAGQAGAAGMAGVAGAAPAVAPPMVTVAPIVRVQSLTSQFIDVTVGRNGNVDPLTVTAEGLPLGVLANSPEIAADRSQAQIEIRASTMDSKGGPYPFALKVTSRANALVTAQASSSLYVTQGVGRLDAGFGRNSILAQKISARGGDLLSDVAVDSLGRVTLVGSGKDESDNDAAWVTRLDKDAALDTSFAGVTAGSMKMTPPSRAYRVALGDNGISVWATSYGETVSFVRELDPNGNALDFNGNAVGGDATLLPATPPLELAALRGGLLALAQPPGSLVALGPTGAKDSTFSPAEGFGASTFAVDPRGGVVYGTTSSSSFVVGRLTPTGSSDEGFGVKGVTSLLFPGGAVKNRFVKLLSNATGTIVGLVESQTGATVNENDVSLIELDAFGVLNKSYGSSGHRTVPTGLGTGHAAFAQPDGRVVVLYSEWDSTTKQPYIKLARFASEGYADSTFLDGKALDIAAAIAPAKLNVRGMVYDPYGHRAVIFGDATEGVVLIKVWL